MPSRRSPSSSPIRSARLRSTRRATSSWWLSASSAAAWAAALQKNGWRTWSTAVRKSSDPQSAKPTRRPQQPVDLRERPQQHEVRVLLEQRDRLVGVLEDVELAVGLVEDHGDVARDVGDERRDLLERQRGRGRVVRVADDDQPRGDGDLLAHLREVVAVLGVDGHLDRARAGGGREVRVDGERRPRVDDLRPGLEQRVAGGEQDVAGAVADRDPVRRARRSGPRAACAAPSSSGRGSG